MIKKVLAEGEPALVYQDEEFENEFEFLAINDKVKKIGKKGKWPYRVHEFKTYATFKGTLRIQEELFLLFEIPQEQTVGVYSGYEIAKLYSVSFNFLAVHNYHSSTTEFFLIHFEIDK